MARKHDPVVCTAGHAVALPGGRLLEPGETADVDTRDQEVSRLLASNQITPVRKPRRDEPGETITEEIEA